MKAKKVSRQRHHPVDLSSSTTTATAPASSPPTGAALKSQLEGRRPAYSKCCTVLNGPVQQGSCLVTDDSTIVPVYQRMVPRFSDWLIPVPVLPRWLKRTAATSQLRSQRDLSHQLPGSEKDSRSGDILKQIQTQAGPPPSRCFLSCPSPVWHLREKCHPRPSLPLPPSPEATGQHELGRFW